MKAPFTLIIYLLLALNCFAQNDHKFVKLSEEKKGKRVTLYATNTDSISYDIFLKIETKDFRRSGNRPIIKNIAANSKTKLITLIKLDGTEGNYDSIFIVNEVSYALELNKDHEDLNIKLDKALKGKNVTLYTKDDCLICPDVKRILENNKITYIEYNIDKDSINYLKIIKAFKADKKNNSKNQIPLLKIDDNVYNNIKSIEDFNIALREAFN